MNSVRSVVFLLVICVTSGVAQPPRFESTELTGVVAQLMPGSSFAYTIVFIDLGKDRIILNYHPKYSKRMMEILRPGNKVTFRANVNFKMWENFKSFRQSDRYNEAFTYFLTVGIITHVLVDTEWESFPAEEPSRGSGAPAPRIYLDLAVRDVVHINGFNKAVVFDDGLVAFAWGASGFWDPLKNTRRGDVLSFVGYELESDPTYAYPIQGVNSLYSFSPLLKAEGRIKSLLYKQNYVCMGLMLETRGETIPVSFPTEWGERMKTFSEKANHVTMYYSTPVQVKSLHPTELHVLISGRDTLSIEKLGFFGGADGPHQHKPATVAGKITQTNRGDNGRLLSIIIGNDCYVEVDGVMERQLQQYLRKGIAMEIEGQERIRKEGEVYMKDYRIIVPQRVSVDGKNFILNNQP